MAATYGHRAWPFGEVDGSVADHEGEICLGVHSRIARQRRWDAGAKIVLRMYPQEPGHQGDSGRDM